MYLCEENWHLLENRKTKYYEVGKGVTKIPITTEEHLTLYPLHTYFRVFGWIYKICYHAVAGHFNWSESKFDVQISKSQRIKNLVEFIKKFINMYKKKLASLLKNRIQQVMVKLPQQVT